MSPMNNTDTEISFTDFRKKDVELPDDFPLQKATVWVDQCISKVYKKPDSRKIFRVLAKLLKSFSWSQEFKNSVSNKIPKIISLCLSSSTVELESSLECLEIILINYGNSSFVCKAKITAHLESFLCSPCKGQVIIKAGNALHLTQQIGSAGKNGSIHKKQWQDYVQVLCKTMHALYDVFFENVKEFSTNINDSTNVTVYDIVPTADSGNANIAHRLRNVNIFLKCALLKPYPVDRSVPFLSIFNVIQRCLVIDEYSEISSQTHDFLDILYNLQIQFLHLLTILLTQGYPGIRTYSEEIFKLLADCLKRTDKQYFADKSEYQTALYDALNKYIILERENLSSSACDTILSHALKYILCMDKSSVVNKTHGNGASQLNPSNPKSTVTNTKCTEAINTVINLMRSTVLINECKLDVLYKFAMDQIMHVRVGRIKEPYLKYTIDLFNILNVLRTLPNYCSLPLLNFTVEMTNSDWRNRRNPVCLQQLEAIENLVNPIYPSLTILNSHSESVSSNRNVIFENEAYARNTNNFVSNNFDNLLVDTNIHADQNSNVEVQKDISKNTGRSSTNIDTTDEEPPRKLSRTHNHADETATGNKKQASFLVDDGIIQNSPLHSKQILLENSDMCTHESSDEHASEEFYDENNSFLADSKQFIEKIANDSRDEAVNSQMISSIQDENNITIKEYITPNTTFAESDEDEMQLFKDVPNSEFIFE